MRSKWVLVTQSCQTLCNPMDCSSPGSSVHEDKDFPGKDTVVGCHFLLICISLILSIKESEWVKVTQSSPNLCDPMCYSLPGSSVLGILQARILEWVAFPFSRGSSQLRNQTRVSRMADSLWTELPGKSKNTGVGVARKHADKWKPTEYVQWIRSYRLLL